jgi:hypothetical protein
MKRLMILGLGVVLMGLQGTVIARTIDCDAGYVTTSGNYEVVKPQIWEETDAEARVPEGGWTPEIGGDACLSSSDPHAMQQPGKGWIQGQCGGRQSACNGRNGVLSAAYGWNGHVTSHSAWSSYFRARTYMSCTTARSSTSDTTASTSSSATTSTGSSTTTPKVLKGQPFLLQWNDPENEFGDTVTIARMKVNNQRTSYTGSRWWANQPNIGWALLTHPLDMKTQFDDDQEWTYMVKSESNRRRAAYSPCFKFTDNYEDFDLTLPATPEMANLNNTKNAFRYVMIQLIPVLGELGGTRWADSLLPTRTIYTTSTSSSATTSTGSSAPTSESEDAASGPPNGTPWQELTGAQRQQVQPCWSRGQGWVVGERRARPREPYTSIIKCHANNNFTAREDTWGRGWVPPVCSRVIAAARGGESPADCR